VPNLRLKASASLVADYFRVFVNRWPYTLQSNRPHPESARHYYYRPKDRKTGQGLSLTLDTIRRHFEGEITVVVFIDEIEKAFAGTGTDLSCVKTEMTGTILTYMQDREADGAVFIGPPGAAKSAAAKATGGTAGIPTIAFDLPAMESSLVGASTERLRTALQIIDAVSQGRMLFIATCDSIASLPPELRRPFTLGTFFFDLPSDEERETIWGIYLKKYGVSGQLPNDEGWTGAEIKECCRKAHRLGITLLQAARYIVPVSRSAAEQIKALRQMASGKFISTSTLGVYQYQENPPASRRRVMRDLDGSLTVMPPSNAEA
jgi:SpoVK/Ycf46/Vps4 family AAA+-type ATPase